MDLECLKENKVDYLEAQRVGVSDLSLHAVFELHFLLYGGTIAFGVGVGFGAGVGVDVSLEHVHKGFQAPDLYPSMLFECKGSQGELQQALLEEREGLRNRKHRSRRVVLLDAHCRQEVSLLANAVQFSHQGRLLPKHNCSIYFLKVLKVIDGQGCRTILLLLSEFPQRAVHFQLSIPIWFGLASLFAFRLLNPTLHCYFTGQLAFRKRNTREGATLLNGTATQMGQVMRCVMGCVISCFMGCVTDGVAELDQVGTSLSDFLNAVLFCESYNATHCFLIAYQESGVGDNSQDIQKCLLLAIVVEQEDLLPPAMWICLWRGHDILWEYGQLHIVPTPQYPIISLSAPLQHSISPHRIPYSIVQTAVSSSHYFKE